MTATHDHHLSLVSNPDQHAEQTSTSIRSDRGLSVTPAADLVFLVPSAEPSVVFSSLAAQCTTVWCDLCTIDLTEGNEARYRISHPSTAAEHTSRSAGARLIQVRFSEQSASATPHQDGIDNDLQPFHGVAYFAWHGRRPTDRDRLTATLLVQYAVRTVAWQRAEEASRTATVVAENLNFALHTSRRIGAAIGILMSLHKLTEEQAFDLLRQASRYAHRKIRDLAVEVVETGWLEPALLELATTGQPSSRGDNSASPRYPNPAGEP